MKKLIILFLTTFLLIPVFGQFQNSYGTEMRETGQSVRTTYLDGGYIIGGYSDYGFIANTDATLLKTDSAGYILWAKQFGGEADDGFYSVRPVSEGADGYVCLGYTNSMGFGNTDFYFVRTDPNGNPLFIRTYGGEEGEIGQCIQTIINEDGEYGLVMIGTSASWTGTAKMFIVKTNIDGEIRQSAIVGFEGYQYGNWIEQTRDGGFIAVGMTNFTCGNDQTIASNYDIYVVKLTYDLNVEWSSIIGGGPDLPYNDLAYSVKETYDGYIVTGYTRSFGTNNSYDAFLLKLYSDGGFQWLRNYGYTFTDLAFDVITEENSDMVLQYVFTGHTYDTSRSTEAMLVATDSNGDVIWARGYGLEASEAGYELDRNSISGYVFTGVECSFGLIPKDIYLVATTSQGDSYCPWCESWPIIISEYHDPCISEGAWSEQVGEMMEFEPWKVEGRYETSPCPERLKSANGEFSNLGSGGADQKGISVFPNPANTYIEIKYAEKYRNGKLTLYNSTGQLIYNDILPEQEMTTVRLDGLESGIYMLNISNNKGESESDKITIAK